MMKRQIHNNETGAVLLMALVFLVLTALIAVTSMDTSIFARKKTGNIQFQEDAMQLTEGVVNEVAFSSLKALDSARAPAVGDVLCMKDSTDPECTPEHKTLTLPHGLEGIIQGGDTYYKVYFNQGLSRLDEKIQRMEEDRASEGTLFRYIEVEGRFNGVEQGLSQADIVIGIKHKALVPQGSAVVDLKATGFGSGAGRYSAFY